MMASRRTFLRRLAGVGAGTAAWPLLGCGTAETTRVACVRQLRTTPGAEGKQARVDHYYRDVEGGGGTFVWKAADPFGRGADGGLVVPAQGEGWWVRPTTDDGLVRTAWFGVGLDGGDDTAATQRACDAVPDGGTLRLEGEVSLSDLITLFGRSVTVEAEDARIRMVDGGGYHAFVFGSPFDQNERTVERVVWKGGTVDGNKEGQNWTDETMNVQYGTGTFDESKRGNVGLITIRGAQNARVERVAFENNVLQAVNHVGVGESVTRDCTAVGGGDPAGVYPGTFSSRYGDAAVFEDCRAEGGNIGFVYTSSQPPPGSQFVVRGCEAKDTTQGAFWCETSEAFVLENFRAEATDPERHNAKIFVNNSVLRTHIRRGVVEGAQIDFNNASYQEEGIVEDVRVAGHYPGEGAAIHNASRTRRCTVENVAGNGIKADVSEEDTVTDFGGRGIEWAEKVIRPTIRRGTIGIFNADRVEGGTIADVQVGVRLTKSATVLDGVEIDDTDGPAVRSRNDAERLVLRNCVLRDFGRAQDRPLGVRGGAAEVEITDTKFALASPADGAEAQAYRGRKGQERLVFNRNTLLGIKSLETGMQHSAGRATVEGNVVRTSGGG
jgi:hypothetical protein